MVILTVCGYCIHSYSSVVQQRITLHMSCWDGKNGIKRISRPKWDVFIHWPTSAALYIVTESQLTEIRGIDWISLKQYIEEAVYTGTRLHAMHIILCHSCMIDTPFAALYCNNAH